MIDAMDIGENTINDLNETRLVVAKLNRLMEDDDFRFLYTQMQSKLDNLVRSCFAEPSGLDGMIKNSYVQGKAAGFKEAMDFPSLLLEGMKEGIANLAYLEEE